MILAITVTGKDRPGIISALAGALYQAGGNLEDASMTILEGEFAMIFLAAVKNRTGDAKLRNRLRQFERDLGLVISVKEVKHRLVRGEKHRPGTTSWIISASGKDRAGIVFHISKMLSEHGLNITDLNSKIIGSGRKAAYALVLEVDIPSQTQLLARLKRECKALERKLRVHIEFNPIDSAHF